MTYSASDVYSERVLPPWWFFAIIALVIPATFLIFFPINQLVGIIVAVVLYLGICAWLILSAPRIAVSATHFSAGRARVQLESLGTPIAQNPDATRQSMHAKWDRAAYYCTVPWIKTTVLVPVIDDDPAPFWVVSTRNPEKIAQLLGASSKQ
ncbi:DUF3093 domain-containing protein [Humidisolicoccus flavus]|uniref:DUF3093 domain-containing protein n=1 Tax=Humidisolicoccus flavus TaxID=3111414 RepID=UPI00324B26FB